MADTKKIGDVLRSKREEKNFSIEDIAHKTKINLNILKSLEANDLESLPNKTYIRGFIKNYAKAISLDPDFAMEVMEETYNDHYNPAPEVTEPEELATEEKVSQEEKPVENQVVQKTKPKKKKHKQEHKQEHKQNINVEPEKEDPQQKFFDSIQNFVEKFCTKRTALTLTGVFGIVISISVVVDIVQKLQTEDHSQMAKTEVVAPKPVIKSADANLLQMEAAKKLAEKMAAPKKEEIVKEAPKKVDVVKEAPKKDAPKKEVAKKEAKLPKGKFPFKDFYQAPANLFTVKDLNEKGVVPEHILDLMDDDKERVFIKATEGDTYISYQSDDGPIKRFVLKNTHGQT